MKVADLGANAVVCKGGLYLAGDVTVDVAESKQKQDQQDHHERSAADNRGRDHNVAAPEK